MAKPKGIGLSEALHEYIVAHGTPPDEVQRRLMARTQSEAGALALMQIAPEQGAFMTLLTRAIGAKRAIEIGTFTGYSALAIARGLPADGKLLCLDISEKWTRLAREAWAEAGLQNRIELQLGPAQETLAAMPAQPAFDLAFIDADKSGYQTYLELLHPRMHSGALVLVDNVLWFGNVVNPEAQDEQTRAIVEFNRRAAADERWDCAMLPLADGLTLLRKR